MTTDLRHVLMILGFEEDWHAMTDKQPGYRLNLGNVEITASEVLSPRSGTVFSFGGWVRGKRTLTEVSFELPLTVESFEQGVAWIVRGIGLECKPETPVPWFGLGRDWQDRLPTAQSAREGGGD